MAKVTNTAKGPRGFYTADGGLVMLEPGESFEGELAKGDLYEGLKSGAAATSSEPKALSAMNKAELLETASSEDVQTFDKDGTETPIAEGTNKEIAAAIEAKRAAA
jgi:hypothetical protein